MFICIKIQGMRCNHWSLETYVETHVMPSGNACSSHLGRILKSGGIGVIERTHAMHKHMQTQAHFSGVLMFNSVNLYVQT